MGLTTAYDALRLRGELVRGDAISCHTGARFDAIVILCKEMKYTPLLVGNSSLWLSVLAMVKSGEGVSLLPLCLGIFAQTA
jgi:hypothetical protein